MRPELKGSDVLFLLLFSQLGMVFENWSHQHIPCPGQMEDMNGDDVIDMDNDVVGAPHPLRVHLFMLLPAKCNTFTLDSV